MRRSRRMGVCGTRTVVTVSERGQGLMKTWPGLEARKLCSEMEQGRGEGKLTRS